MKSALHRTWIVSALALSACDPGMSSSEDGGGGDAPPAEDASERDTAVSDTPSSDAPDGGVALGCEGPLARDLCFLREEEKLARDVYVALFEETAINVFDNISRSEESHTAAVAALMVARSIPDPVTDDTPGVFRDPVFVDLYATLTAQGRMGEVAALTVGATIEDLDLRDIREMEARTTDAEALALYASLACGSRNHMRSFASQLDSRGVTYEAAYITPAELAAILAAPREMCGP